jgi:hypothetical protein
MVKKLSSGQLKALAFIDGRGAPVRVSAKTAQILADQGLITLRDVRGIFISYDITERGKSTVSAYMVKPEDCEM